jgi:Methyltransferase domain
MKYWSDRVIKPYCQDFSYKSICEIGASVGGATDILAGASEFRLDIVDPCLDVDLCAKYSANKQITVHRGLSLGVIPQLSGKFDCILIDGDHNWYTVFHELKAIDEKQLLADGGTIFFHDVGWPYGRRDMYYQPETIPAEFRQPYAQKGMVPGRSELSSTEGVNKSYYNAQAEGGPKNGVLTAIEDFYNERPGQYVFFRFKGEAGLGVLLKKGGMKSGSLLAKWRRRCFIENKYVGLKNTVSHLFPGGYRAVKRIAGKSPAS